MHKVLGETKKRSPQTRLSEIKFALPFDVNCAFYFYSKSEGLSIASPKSGAVRLDLGSGLSFIVLPLATR